MSEITVPTFVKGESGFAAKLNELASAVLSLASELATVSKELEALKASAPAKATTTRKAATKAE